MAALESKVNLYRPGPAEATDTETNDELGIERIDRAAPESRENRKRGRLAVQDSIAIAVVTAAWRKLAVVGKADVIDGSRLAISKHLPWASKPGAFGCRLACQRQAARSPSEHFSESSDALSNGCFPQAGVSQHDSGSWGPAQKVGRDAVYPHTATGSFGDHRLFGDSISQP